MPFLALIVAVAAVSVGCINASVASPVGRMHAHTTVGHQQFEWMMLPDLLAPRGLCERCGIYHEMSLRLETYRVALGEWT